jgi:hypothetical protein
MSKLSTDEPNWQKEEPGGTSSDRQVLRGDALQTH